jgi:formyltetrahydrofolate synthetase
MVIADVKSAIGTLKSSLTNSKEEIATYRKLDDEVKALSKPLEIMNKQRTSLHPAAALASLTLPGSQEYSIKSISVQEGAGFLAVQIEGIIDSNGFSNIQATFELAIEQIGKIPGYAVASSTLDIKQKSFTIQARYTSAAPKGK